MRRAVGVHDLTHHEVTVDAAGSGKIATASTSSLKHYHRLGGRRAVKHPDRAFFQSPGKSTAHHRLASHVWVGSYPSNQMYSNFALSSIRIGHVPDEPVYEQFPSESLLIRSALLINSILMTNISYQFPQTRSVSLRGACLRGRTPHHALFAASSDCGVRNAEDPSRSMTGSVRVDPSINT